MSRMGKQPISVPGNVKIGVSGRNVTVEGPKGKLVLGIPGGIKVEQQGSQLVISRASNMKQNRANHGTIRARIANMVVGITEGHKKEVEWWCKKFSAIPINELAVKLGQNYVPYNHHFLEILRKNKKCIIGNSDIHLTDEEIKIYG